MSLRQILLRLRYLVYVVRREAICLWLRLSRTSGKRILTVFDPSLIAFNGHHLEWARMIKSECQSKFDVRFYANLQAKLRIILSLPAQPIADDGIYPPPGDFDDVYRNMTASTIASLNRIHRMDVGSDAILIIHTVTLYQLGAIARWFSTLPTSGRPRLCLQFQFPLEFRLSEDVAVRKRATNLAREAAGMLSATGRIRFAANSRMLADQIAGQLQQPCTALPLPIQWPELNRTISPDLGIVFGFFGGLRREKGASLIAQAIPVFAAQYPDTRFLLHAPAQESDPAAVRALATVPQVELIQNNFAQKADYFRQFIRASCILLPYDPVEYAYRTSGILVEALGLGRLIVTTKESWLWAEAQRCGGTVFPMTDFTPSALFSSLRIARDYLVKRILEPKINRNVIINNSPAAFCSALIQLASQ